MAKLTLSSLTSSYRSNAALNANFDAIEAAIENTLSRDGTSPNAMAANLDMGSNLIVNLADPTAAQEGATKNYVDGVISTGAANAAAAAASAAAAAVSETNAASSEANAATSASNAATSASNAATSEANAEAAYDAFDDRYLGSKASAPTLDNDGDALLDGALYWDTTDNALYVYDLGNTTWVRTTDGIVSVTTNEFTGDGSTVAFTISGSPPSDGHLVVTVDGVSQPISSYSVSGTTLTFTEAPPTDSLVEARGFEFASYSSIDLSSYVTKTGTDTLTNKTLTSPVLNGTLSGTGISQYTYVVDTIAELKALTGGVNEVVEVKGHTTAGDGGGGLFRWDAADTTTDDNGVYIQPNAGGTGRWIRQYKPGELNIDWFGANGDGATDDSSVIESVVSSMSAGEVLSFSPGKVYHCDNKIDVTGKLGISFTTGSSRNNDGAVNARVVLDAASVDDTLFNFSETSGVLFKNITLEGPGRSVSGSHVVKATDGSGDIDFYFEGCTIMSAETLVRMEGRNIHFMPGCALVDFNTVLEIDWPTSYSTGANDDQTNENGMRGYVIDGCRIHAGSSGFMVKNSGSNAHFIKGIQITNNYIDTNTRMFTGHAREFLFANNININNGAKSSALFEIQDDLNTVGGVVNYDVSILNNVFSGMSDSVTTDRSMLGIATIYNTSGIKIIGNLFSRVDRNVLTLIDVTDFNISGNTYRDCQLDNIVPEANGALRRDIIFASGTSSRGYIGNETVSTSHTPDSVQPIVETSSATVTELVIGPISFDATKWSRTDYAESDNAFGDFTVGGDLTVTGDVAQDLSFVQGKKVILDTDGDTYIRCALDDDMRFGIGGSEPLQINANGVGFGPAGISYPGDFGGTGISAFRSYTNAQSQTAHVFGAQNSSGSLISMGLIYCSPSDYTAGSEDSRFRIEHRVAGALVNKELCVSDGGTGGTGSAGSGNQYVEMEINGTTYKVLHDGTV